MRSSHRYQLGWVAAVVAVAAFLIPQLSWAHHGWGWATDEEFGITGRIVDVRLGNPHGDRSAREGELLVTAERVVIDGRDYELHPDRES